MIRQIGGNGMAVIKMILIDKHTLMRQGLKELFELDDNFEIVADASNSAEAFEVISDYESDIILLDIFSLYEDGLKVLYELNQRKRRGVKIMVIAGSNDIINFMKAIEIGVDGYILKECSLLELKSAVHNIINGEIYIQPDLLSYMDVKKMTWKSDNEKIESLTRRELEVLKNLTVGMYNKEIALKLGISERTVKNHVSNIFKKVGVADRTQAAVFAIRSHLVKIE